MPAHPRRPRGARGVLGSLLATPAMEPSLAPGGDGGCCGAQIVLHRAVALVMACGESLQRTKNALCARSGASKIRNVAFCFKGDISAAASVERKPLFLHGFLLPLRLGQGCVDFG